MLLIVDLIKEKSELYKKIRQLEAFIEGDEFNMIGMYERALLRRQVKAMRDYSDVLASRIEII